jgi:hypothetical protein
MQAQMGKNFVISGSRIDLMRLRTYFYWLGASLMLPLWGCRADGKGESQLQTQSMVVMDVVPEPCGASELVAVYEQAGRAIGMFEVANDSAYLYFNYSPPVGFELNEVAIYCGESQALPQTGGKADPLAFPIRYTGLAARQPWVARMPWAEMPACMLVVAYVRVSNENEELAGWTNNAQGELQRIGINYCLQACGAVVTDCALGDPAKQPTTMVQDQWASEAGRQALQLLKANFASLFPKGVSIGCNERLTYSSAEAALAVLPMAGAAAALQPDNAHPANELAGELLSLTLTLRLDEIVPDFSPQSQPLYDLQVATGAFEGWRVEEVVREANAVLGGCASNYTPAQMHDVVAEINQSFAQGRPASGFLRCPID